MTSLEEIAKSVRKDVVRMVGNARAGCAPQALSVLDILVYLYEREIDLGKDKLVMGKEYGCPALYALLARKGFFDREALWDFRRLGALLQGHPDGSRTPGIDASAGSPGLALGIANGMAMAAGAANRRVFCVIGDEELQEGALWESVAASSQRKLDSVVLVIDRSGGRTEEHLEDARRPDSLDAKFQAFGWNAVHADGHDFASLQRAFSLVGEAGGTPSAVIARTKRGKGISIWEDRRSGSVPKLSPLETERVLEELDEGGDPHGQGSSENGGGF